MTQRQLIDFLQDILEAIVEIEGFIQGLNFEQFTQDRAKVLAVVKLLEMIGEATKQIPAELRGRYPHIPWQSVTGMRDVLVHAYWKIDENVVWETLMESLPLLKPVIIELIDHELSV